MKTKLKICGIQDLETAQFCEQQGIDFIGLNMYESSPRFIPLDQAIQIADTLKNTKVVLLFVNHPLEEALSITHKINPDYVQLHGAESPDYCGKFNHPLIKAMPIGNEENFEECEKYLDYVDYFLFDTKNENHGGTGQSFDWDLLKQYTFEKPYFLAGGINSNNLSNAISTLAPYGIDIASGAETDGKKDAQKIHQLLDIIKQYEAQ